MSPPEIDAALHQQLGSSSLDAKVDRILADQDQARADRKQQYQKSEAMDRRIDDRKLSDLDSRLKKMEPITADIGRCKERFIGMRLLIVMVAAAFAPPWPPSASGSRSSSAFRDHRHAVAYAAPQRHSPRRPP